MPAPVVPVRLEAGADHVVVLVPTDRYEVRVGDGVAAVLRDGQEICAGAVVDAPERDAALPPLTGVAVAALDPSALRLVADAWAAEVAAALTTADDRRRRALTSAQGEARVLRALAGDLDDDAAPTAEDFDAATAAGLVTPRRLAPRGPALSGRAMSPLVAQEEQSARVAARLAELGGTGRSMLRSRSAFAGITAAAALVLTGCASEPGAGDRRCTDASGRVVDDTNCRTYGGGGSGGYYYRYGGSTYSQGGKTYLNGGSLRPPESGSGFYGRSGGGG